MKLSSISYHLKVIKEEIFDEPLNKGHRLGYVLDYLRWNLFYKYRNKKWVISFDNGFRSYVYPFPDHDSGEANIYTKNVDYLDIQFIRNHLQPGDTIIDAGCNVGNRTLAIADLISGALLIDAGAMAVRRTRENLELNNLPADKFKVIHCAVGEETGTVSFTDIGGASTRNKISTGNATTNTVQVPLRRIDDIASEYNFKPAFIKLDVEGFDFAALKGARTLLQSGSVRLVKFEKWPGQQFEPLVEFFEGLGWKLFFLNEDATINDNPDELGKNLNLFAAPVSYYSASIIN